MRILTSKYLLKFQGFQIQSRYSSKIAVQLDANLIKKLENEEIKPRHHPGIYKVGAISLPNHIIKGIQNSIGDHPIKSLITEGQKITTYFKARHPPPENSEIRRKIQEIENELDQRYLLPDLTKMTEEEISRYKQKRENKIKKILKQRIFSWKPMEYNEYEALCYAVGRGAKEYAALSKYLKKLHYVIVIINQEVILILVLVLVLECGLHQHFGKIQFLNILMLIHREI